MSQSKTSQGASRAADAEEVARAVQDFQSGVDSERSFGVLVRTYDSAVKGFFSRRLESAEESLDLTQETFLRVYKGLKGYRGDAPFGAWLFGIAWNVLRRRVANSRIRKSVPLDARELELAQAAVEPKGTSEELPAFAAALRSQRQAILWQAVARLPPQRRRCLTLWARHELTYEQIAVVMRLSLGTVKAHLAQARAQLGELVNAEEGVRNPHE